MVVGDARWPWVRASMGQAANSLAIDIQLSQDILQRRHYDAIARLAQHQTVGEVIDVLGGAGEVNERDRAFQLRVRGEFLAQKILDRLNIMIGTCFYVLDPLRAVEVEVRGQTSQVVGTPGLEWRQLGDGRFAAQELEPAHLGDHAIANEPELAEQRAQRRGVAVVAAIEWGHRGERRDLAGGRLFARVVHGLAVIDVLRTRVAVVLMCGLDCLFHLLVEHDIGCHKVVLELGH